MRLTPLQVEVLTYLGEHPGENEMWRLAFDLAPKPTPRTMQGRVDTSRYMPVVVSLRNRGFVMTTPAVGAIAGVAITEWGKAALSEYAFGEP